VSQRGWAALTLKIVRGLRKEAFDLSELYTRESEFASVYPSNRHIREKIRQQLQVLRDLGILRFKGSGRYELTN
jgi:type II restriction enzyme